jgi:hypothetical protein
MTPSGVQPVLDSAILSSHSCNVIERHTRLRSTNISQSGYLLPVQFVLTLETFIFGFALFELFNELFPTLLLFTNSFSIEHGQSSLD